MRALFGLCLVLAGCTLRAYSEAEALTGDWVLAEAHGVIPPDDFQSQIVAGPRSISIRSRWHDFANGQQPLTLIGLMLPELTLDTTGAELAAQVGPFVFRHKSRRDGTRVVTQWSTSEYMGASFQGTWTRALSEDGKRLTLDINAGSGQAESRAQLVFRRR